METRSAERSGDSWKTLTMVSWREREARNETDARARNEWTDGASQSFGAHAATETFVCERGDASCNCMIELSQAEHESVRAVSNRFAIAVNHENPEAEVVISEGRRFAVVDKIEGWGATHCARHRPTRRRSTLGEGMTSPSGSSTVTHQDVNGTWIIALDGEHDISTTPVLDEQIRRLLPCCTRAIDDLSSTTFIDASVIGWLMRTRGALATGTNAMSVVRGNPGGIADRIFDILRLHAELSVYSTRKDALAHTGPLANLPELHVSGEVDPSTRGRRRRGEGSNGG